MAKKSQQSEITKEQIKLAIPLAIRKREEN